MASEGLPSTSYDISTIAAVDRRKDVDGMAKPCQDGGGNRNRSAHEAAGTAYKKECRRDDRAGDGRVRVRQDDDRHSSRLLVCAPRPPGEPDGSRPAGLEHLLARAAAAQQMGSTESPPAPVQQNSAPATAPQPVPVSPTDPFEALAAMPAVATADSLSKNRVNSFVRSIELPLCMEQVRSIIPFPSLSL